MSETTKKALHYCVFLLLLGIICGGLLALVNSVTAPIIQEYQEQLVQAELKEIFGEDSSFPTVEKPSETAKEINNIYLWNDKTGVTQAIVYKVTTSGYGGDIISIIAFDINSNKVVGFKVVSASAETRGNATEFDFGLVGEVASDDMNMNIMSGATVTSTAVRKGAEIASNHFNSYKDEIIGVN